MYTKITERQTGKDLISHRNLLFVALKESTDYRQKELYTDLIETVDKTFMTAFNALYKNTDIKIYRKDLLSFWECINTEIN